MTRFNFKVLRLYKDVPFGFKLYTLIRCAFCSFDEIERYVPEECNVLDVGCGHGIFANLLAIKSERRHVIGMDIIKKKIEIAKSTISGRKNIEFEKGDFWKSTDLKNIGCFTFIDVLYYIPLDEKRKLLQQLYDNLPAGGRLVIKSIYEFPRWKYWCSVFHMSVIDKVVHKGLGKNTHFMTRGQYSSLLADIGFQVDFVDINRGYPYPNCLYICNKSEKGEGVNE